MRKTSLIFLFPILVFCAFICAECKKHNERAKTELEKLPPITQIGDNTFGCLLNGMAWIPKDNYGQATFKLDADPTFQDGVFGVSAIKYYSSEFQSISVGSDSCKSLGIYPFTNSRNNVRYTDYGIPFELASYDFGTTCIGNLNITRYDLQNRIFSGTFEFIIYKTGSDTIKITNGRFDKKL